MAKPRHFLFLTLLFSLALAMANGCRTAPPSQEPEWRQEVDSALREFKAANSYHYRLKLENWIGVSGQSIYGNQQGEGSYVDADFSLQLLQQSPAGDEVLGLASSEGKTFLMEGNSWREATPEEMPSPLCDPRRLLETITNYDTVQLEGEEERAGALCHRYLLKLGPDKARLAFSPRAWSYFSQLKFDVTCHLWVCDPALPPASIQVEVVGFDPEESLQRYRLLATVDLYDVGSPDVEVTIPDVQAQQ